MCQIDDFILLDIAYGGISLCFTPKNPKMSGLAPLGNLFVKNILQRCQG